MKMPPKPPRVPAMLYSRAALSHYAMLLGVLGINAYVALEIVGHSDNDFSLAVIAAAIALSALSIFQTVAVVLRALDDWRELRERWEELHRQLNGSDDGN